MMKIWRIDDGGEVFIVLAKDTAEARSVLAATLDADLSEFTDALVDELTEDVVNGYTLMDAVTRKAISLREVVDAAVVPRVLGGTCYG